jgi:hypothetical protein
MIDPDGRFSIGFMFDLMVRLQAWAQEQMDATTRLATGTSGQINAPAEVDVPQRVQDISRTVGTLQDATTVMQGIVAVTEVIITSPGMDMLGDPVMGFAYLATGDIENAVPYALATIIPGVSSVGVKTSVKFLKVDELAKRLGTTAKDFHSHIKPIMKRDFAKEMKAIGTTNPDFTANELGNIVLKNPQTGKTITTNVPLNTYKQ